MKNKILVILAIVLSCNILQAQDSEQNNSDIIYKKLDLKEQVIGNEKVLMLKENKFSNDILTQKNSGKEKSPILAAALSAAVPGAGQFYAKSFIKSAIFLGVEAGLWITYAIFQNQGDDQTDFYRKYADENWDIRKYAGWLVDQGFQGSGQINLSTQDLEQLRLQVNACEDSAGFSHKLPPFGDQQYYEVIGKYRTYMAGWSEVSGITKNNYETITLPSQIDYYMNEREQANTYYNNASLTLTVVIVNHLLSAADAVWSVSIFNKSLEVKTSVNVKYIYSASNFKYNLTPFANLRLSF